MKPRATPQKKHSKDDDDEEDDHVVLVEGNHPRVLEEESDLVIMEDIEEEPVKPLPSPVRMPLAPTVTVQSPRTPPPRSRARPSLHRAVLIRSAQRVALKRIEKDEEQKEKATVVREMLLEDEGEESESEEDEDEDMDKPTKSAGGGWRKSLEAVTSLIFRSGSATPEAEGQDSEQGQAGAVIDL